MSFKKKLIHILLYIPIVGHYIKCMKAGLYPTSIWKFFKINTLKIGSHYYPMPDNCIVQHAYNIYVGSNSHPFRIGCYYQAEGGIYIGSYVDMTNYCTLISTNHDLYSHRVKHPKPIIIHDYCWIGSHSTILAGVELGPRTIVGAGSVVTKSFPEGYCVIAGNPARIIKYLDKSKVVLEPFEYECYGALTKQQFEKYKYKYLKVEKKNFLKNELL